jgi:cytochrome c peroxidase
MREAAATHLQFEKGLSDDDVRQILDFEQRLYVAQESDHDGGSLDSGGATGGAEALANGKGGLLGDAGSGVWSEFDAWAKDDPSLPPAQLAFRQSVARGAKLFRDRTFLISDTAGINSPMGFGNPVRNGCAFCHNMSHTGMDVAPGQVDLGTTNLPFADPQPDLPLFKVTCRGSAHPHYGPVIYTHDPGYALTTGRCADVGRITLQSLRGLSARAPYFSNGSAKDLKAVVEFYDRRYAIGLTDQEKQDLVNLMRVL